MLKQVVWSAPEEHCYIQRSTAAAEGPKKCDSPDLATAVIIRGLTRGGQSFRPSDWCQRLADAATFNCSYCSTMQGRTVNPYVRVVIDDGVYSLRISHPLAEVDPPLYEFMIRFGRDNDLQLISV